MNRCILVTTLCLSLATSARADEPALASLFPSQTFAYAEIRDLTLIMDVWAGFVKGTPFEGSLKASADRKDQQDRTDRSVSPAQLQAQTTFDQIGILSSPEFQREVKKFKGIAVGVTGWQATGKPEFLAIIQTGDSQSAGLIVRMIFLSYPEFRRVASWGDIPVYQSKPPEVNIPVEGKERFAEAAKPKPESNIPTFAYRPGLFVVGSQHSDVIQVLKRFVGKGDEKITFADSDRYRAARILQKPRSLFLFASPRTAFEKWEPLARSHPDWDESTFAGWMRFVVNPSAIPSVAANVSFEQDGWSAVCQIDADPAKSSPLLGLLTAGNATLPSNREPGITLKVNDPTGERQLAFADAVARAMGTVGRFPSDIVRKAEKETGTKWKSELLPSIESIRILLPEHSKAKPHAMGISNSAMVFSFNSAERAAQFEKALPGLLRAADPADKVVTPSEEIIDPIIVRSYAVTFPLISTVHMSRKESQIAFALTRDAASWAVQFEQSSSVRGEALLGRWPIERFFNDDPSKPFSIRPPYAPPSAMKDVFSPLPDIHFSAVRQKDTHSLTVMFDHRGWEPERIRQCVNSFVNWWENRANEKVPGAMDEPIEKLGMLK